MKILKPTNAKKSLRDLKPTERRAVAGGPGDDEELSSGQT